MLPAKSGHFIILAKIFLESSDQVAILDLAL